MEAAFPLSPSLRILKSPKPNPNLLQSNIPTSSSSSPKRSISINAAISPSSSSKSNSCFSSSHFDSWKPVPSLLRDRRPTLNRLNAKAHEETEEVLLQSSSLLRTFQLGVLIVFWYALTTFFNIYNKQVLKTYPFPWTISTLHFGIGTLIVLFMWTFNLHKRPKISTSQLVAILPLAIAHTLGNLFTNMSLGKVSVSFTHTIKAMEPFFSVILSALFLGEIPTFWVVSSLVPVVGGVALASFTEASFDWIGFWSAMASNLTNQSRNVFSKKFMIKKDEDYLDNITLFSIITIMSFILMAPATLLMEGVKFTPAYLQSAGLNINDICVRSLMAGLFYHAYQQTYTRRLEVENAQLSDSVEDLQSQELALKEEINRLRVEIVDYSSVLYRKNVQNIHLHARKKTLHTEVHLLKAELHVLNEKLAEAESTVDSLTEIVKLRDDEVGDLKKKLEDVSRELCMRK